jgi:hypothetical protein
MSEPIIIKEGEVIKLPDLEGKEFLNWLLNPNKDGLLK